MIDIYTYICSKVFNFDIYMQNQMIICVHVRKFVTLSIIFWTICSNLKKKKKKKKNKACLWVLAADCFLFCYGRDFMLSFLKIIKLKLYKYLTLLQTIYSDSTDKANILMITLLSNHHLTTRMHLVLQNFTYQTLFLTHLL